MAKTVVGLFGNREHAQMAIRELVDMGIPRSDISLMSRTEGEAKGLVDKDKGPVERTQYTETETAAGEGAAVGAGVGAALGGLGGLLVGLGALVIPGIGPILAAGPLVAALTGAAVGAGVGALVGTLVGMGVPEEEAQYYVEGVRRGGTLVAVNTPEQRVNEVTEVLRRHYPVDIKKQAQTWRQAGWKGYDPNAKPLTWEELERERSYFPEVKESDMERNRMQSRSRVTERPVEEHVGARGTMPRSNMGTQYTEGVRPWTDYETDFRRDFERRWKGTSAMWDEYEPVYHYGYDMATDPRYRDRDWDDVERNLREDWEDSHDTAWDDIKDAVRTAWDKIRGY